MRIFFKTILIGIIFISLNSFADTPAKEDTTPPSAEQALTPEQTPPLLGAIKPATPANNEQAPPAPTNTEKQQQNDNGE